MTKKELRVKVPTMTISEMKSLRNEIEKNYTDNDRIKIQILSLACINKFKKTLSSL